MPHELPTPTVDAVTSLGGDIAFSVSLAIGQELLAAVEDAEWPHAGLVAIMLALITMLAWASSTLKQISKSHSDLLGFVATLLNVAHRIALVTLVQVLASLATAGQPLRAVRVVTLMGVATFFLFLQSTARVGSLHRQE